MEEAIVLYGQFIYAPVHNPGGEEGRGEDSRQLDAQEVQQLSVQHRGVHLVHAHHAAALDRWIPGGAASDCGRLLLQRPRGPAQVKGGPEGVGGHQQRLLWWWCSVVDSPVVADPAGDRWWRRGCCSFSSGRGRHRP